MLVIGNGESRKGIDIDTIQDTKIGCNAIHRDYHVDHLICVDRRMVKEAIEQGANNGTKIYTRENWYNNYKNFDNVYTVPTLPYKGKNRPDDPFHWGSGPYAVLFASKNDQVIKLLGFDLFSNNSKVNNVYKDTTGYDSSDKHAVDPRYWIYQIGKIFEIYTARNFIIYQNDDWVIPNEWKFPNISVDNLNNL